jgi:hypothetical protein
VVAALPDQLPEGAASQYIAISERLCDGPCPGAEQGAWQSHVFVEFVDGREPTTLLIEASPNILSWEPVPTVYFRAVASSARLNAMSSPFSLGHCGLSSGIDIDGSFWDPVGVLGLNHPDSINAAEGTFSLTSPVTARLATKGGLVVDVHRHTGPKYLPRLHVTGYPRPG